LAHKISLPFNDTAKDEIGESTGKSIRLPAMTDNPLFQGMMDPHRCGNDRTYHKSKSAKNDRRATIRHHLP